MIVSISSKLSTTILPTSFLIANSSSEIDLLFPWKITFSIGKPTDIAVYISPPETASIPTCVSFSILTISLAKKALLAYTAIVLSYLSKKSTSISFSLSLILPSDITYKGVPYFFAKSVKLTPENSKSPIILSPHY